MKRYAQKNAVPILWEMLFILSCLTLPSQAILYTNFLFYLGLVLWFGAMGEFSLREWRKNFRAGKCFWYPVLWTIFGLIGFFALTILLEQCFPQWDTGTIALHRDNAFQLLIFAVSTIVLPPLAEELLFRKSLLCTTNKLCLGATLLLSLFLYALEHALTPWGIFLTMLWGVPLSLSYIKTKNIYIPMTAHFLVNLLGNGVDVLLTLLRWVG